MRTYQETVRVGEWTDSIDPDYDWTSHDWGDGRGGVNPNCTSEGHELILEIAANPELYRYSPCFCVVKDVLCAGMYDGWPFWRPTPAIGIRETLGYGIEAVFFYKLHRSNVYRKPGPFRNPLDAPRESVQAGAAGHDDPENANQ